MVILVIFLCLFIILQLQSEHFIFSVVDVYLRTSFINLVTINDTRILERTTTIFNFEMFFDSSKMRFRIINRFFIDIFMDI